MERSKQEAEKLEAESLGIVPQRIKIWLVVFTDDSYEFNTNSTMEMNS
jgi:hypothetical protein